MPSQRPSRTRWRWEHRTRRALKRQDLVLDRSSGGGHWGQRGVGCLVVLLALQMPASGKAIAVLFTCDVESRHAGQTDLNIWGVVAGVPEPHGIERMMDIFDRHNAKATFFVNVYEVPWHGQEAVARVCRTIHSRGHDVQLHTHPGPMFGVAQLSDADLATQTAIIRRGAGMLESWLGNEVLAHRAGSYMANRDTIRACRARGIPMEFSLVWGGGGSPIAREISTINAPVVVDDVLIVPVTSYVQAAFGDYRSTRFLDIESSSPAEIRKVVGDLQEHDVRTAVIMMHSFSFVRGGRVNERVERALDELVRNFAADPNVRLVTARQLYEIWRSDPAALQGSDYVPTTGWWMTYCRAWQRLDEGWKNVAVAFCPAVPVGMLLAAIGLRRHLRRSGARE